MFIELCFVLATTGNTEISGYGSCSQEAYRPVDKDIWKKKILYSKAFAYVGEGNGNPL